MDRDTARSPMRLHRTRPRHMDASHPQSAPLRMWLWAAGWLGGMGLSLGASAAASWSPISGRCSFGCRAADPGHSVASGLQPCGGAQRLEWCPEGSKRLEMKGRVLVPPRVHRARGRDGGTSLDQWLDRTSTAREALGVGAGGRIPKTGGDARLTRSRAPHGSCGSPHHRWGKLRPGGKGIGCQVRQVQPSGSGGPGVQRPSGPRARCTRPGHDPAHGSSPRAASSESGTFGNQSSVRGAIPSGPSPSLISASAKCTESY
jgi:hypothetical protein